MVEGRRVSARVTGGADPGGGGGRTFQAAPAAGIPKTVADKTDPKLLNAATSIHRLMRLWAPAIRAVPGIGPVFSNAAIVLGRSFATVLAEENSKSRTDLRLGARATRMGFRQNIRAFREGFGRFEEGHKTLGGILRTGFNLARAATITAPTRLGNIFRTTSDQSMSIQRRGWNMIPEGIRGKLSGLFAPLKTLGAGASRQAGAAGLMGKGMGKMAAGIGGMMGMMAGVLGAVVAIAMLSKIFRNLLGSVFGILGMFMDMMVMPFMPLFMMIIGTLLKLQPSIMKIVGAVTMLLDIMMPLIELSLMWLTTIVELIADLIVIAANIIGAALSFIVPVLTVISGFLLAVVQGIIGLVVPALTAISGFILDMARTLGGWLQNVADFLVAGFLAVAEVVSWLGDFIGKVIEGIGWLLLKPLEALDWVFGKVWGWFTSVMEPVFNVIKTVLGAIQNFLQNPGKAVGGAIKGLFGFQGGSQFVPQTGPAILHRGEMVIPRQQANAMRSGAANISMQNVFNITQGDPRRIASDIQTQLSRAMIMGGTV